MSLVTNVTNASFITDVTYTSLVTNASSITTTNTIITDVTYTSLVTNASYTTIPFTQQTLVTTFILFQRFVSHVITLKRNNVTETKQCFAFVLFKFCFSFISRLYKHHYQIFRNFCQLEVCLKSLVFRDSGMSGHLCLVRSFSLHVSPIANAAKT